jgi:murein DD-endopeptidase MepM/ murein hydrolase activator NlpD
LPLDFVRWSERIAEFIPARRRRARRGVWVLLALALVATVTIASIPSREEIAATTTAASVSGGRLTAYPPPQTLERLDASSQQTPAGETVDAAAAVTAPPLSLSAFRVTEQAAAHTYIEITVRQGDTLSDILKRLGLEQAEVMRALTADPQAQPFFRLRPGEVLRLKRDGARLVELSYQPEPGELTHLRATDQGYELRRETRRFETRLAYVSGVIHSSLFEDAQAAGLSDALIMKLVEIFGWDIDFALDVQPGDRFAVIHEERYWLGQKVADGPIVAAEFVSRKNRREPFRAIGYRHPDGQMRYYTPEGLSVRRQFLRTPVEFSRITSRFSHARFHPILQSPRAHKGVDYGAPVGTPVRATASGRVIALGWHGGYGNRIELRHGGSYTTLYAHLSRFAPSLRLGSYVDQGQIIGYVGRTGLATGPHLHYEFRVNGVHQDPLRYKFPAARPLPDHERAAFLREASVWMERLDLISRGPSDTLRTASNRP